MQYCDTLIAARWCAPVEPAGRVLDNHVVAVADGRIVDLLPREKAATTWQASLLIERPDHLLIPGLINAHTHAAMTLMRGFADDVALEPWLNNHIWPAERRWLSAEMVRDGTELAIAEMLSGGVTCFSDQYFFPEMVAATAADLHIRAMVGTPVVDFPTPWARDAADCLSKASDLVHDAYADHPLISSCFAPHSTYALCDESFVKLRVIADQLERPVQIHLHETAAEIALAVQSTGLRPLQRLTNLGLVNATLLAVHGVHLNDAEIHALVDAGASLAHCPKSNLKLASGIAPIARMRAVGLRVAIGTDGAASNNTLDMLDEMQFAALLGKARAEDAAAISATEALRMATIDGAHALGLADKIGSIEPGKWADLACVNLRRLNSQPLYDAVSQLVYTARAEQVSDVWVAGRHLLDDHRLTHIDIDDLYERSSEWQQRMTQAMT